MEAPAPKMVAKTTHAHYPQDTRSSAWEVNTAGVLGEIAASETSRLHVPKPTKASRPVTAAVGLQTGITSAAVPLTTANTSGAFVRVAKPGRPTASS